MVSQEPATENTDAAGVALNEPVGQQLPTETKPKLHVFQNGDDAPQKLKPTRIPSSPLPIRLKKTVHRDPIKHKSPKSGPLPASSQDAQQPADCHEMPPDPLNKKSPVQGPGGFASRGNFRTSGSPAACRFP